jgi:hypothetical protein
MWTRTDARRRQIGVLFLLTAAALLVAGQTFLQADLGRGLAFLVFWLICFVFTALAIFTALLDLWVVRRRARQEQRNLMAETTQVVRRLE